MTPAPVPKPEEKPTTSDNEAKPRAKPGEPPTPVSDRDEIGGPEGPEPTRFGDWERKGRCIDF